MGHFEAHKGESKRERVRLDGVKKKTARERESAHVRARVPVHSIFKHISVALHSPSACVLCDDGYWRVRCSILCVHARNVNCTVHAYMNVHTSHAYFHV